MNNTNNQSARESYRQAMRMFYLAFRDKFQPGQAGNDECEAFVNQLKLTQGEVRCEVQLLTTLNQYTFGVTPNQQNSNNILFTTERRMPLQDSICVNEYAIFVGNPASAVDTAYQLRSYGNFFDFGAAPAAALNSTFYSNGAFKLTINNDVIIPYRGLLNHWYKPQTQQTGALAAASPDDQLRGAEDGAITAEPNFVLIGSKNNEPQILLQAPLAAVTTFERAILVMRGIYAQNSTVVS